MPEHDAQTADPQPRARRPAGPQADLSSAVMDRVFALGDRVTKVEADVGHALAEVAGLRGEVHDVRATGQRIEKHLEAQDRTADEADRTRKAAMDGVVSRVEGLDTRLGEGFARLGDRLDAGLPQLDFVNGLITHAERRRSRRVRWSAWLDDIFGLARWFLSAIGATVAGFAFTHPVGRLPDPDLLPTLAALGMLLAFTVAWTSYRKVHREAPEAPDVPEHEQVAHARGH